MITVIGRGEKTWKNQESRDKKEKSQTEIKFEEELEQRSPRDIILLF